MAEYDLSDPGLLFRDDVLEDPTELYRTLREQAPVWEIPGTATFVVSSAALVLEAVARTDDFSSNLVSLLYRGPDGCPVAFDMSPLGDATHVLATADPPAHTRHRKLLQPELAPAGVAPLEDDIRVMVDDLLEAPLHTRRADIMAVLCEPLPARVICRVIGLPAADTPKIVELALGAGEILAGVVDADGIGRAAAAALESAAYLGGHVERAIAGDAVPGSLLEVLGREVRTATMTPPEAVGILVQLVGAGTETTTSLIGRAVRTLADDPALQTRLRGDPALIPNFVEETLRIDGPFRFHYRTTPHPTQLGGVAIPSGARVLLMWAAANLDTALEADPACIDLERPNPKSHLAFGRGIHFCIGAPLARLEARVAIEELLALTAAIDLDPGRPPKYRRTIFMHKLAHLDVLFSPRS